MPNILVDLARTHGGDPRPFDQMSYCSKLPLDEHQDHGHCFALALGYLARFRCEWLVADPFGTRSFFDLVQREPRDPKFQSCVIGVQNSHESLAKTWALIKPTEEAPETEKFMLHGTDYGIMTVSGRMKPRPIGIKTAQLIEALNPTVHAVGGVRAFAGQEPSAGPRRSFVPPYHDLILECCVDRGRYLLQSVRHAMAIYTKAANRDCRRQPEPAVYAFFDPNYGEASFSDPSRFHRFVVDFLNYPPVMKLYVMEHRLKAQKLTFPGIDT